MATKAGITDIFKVLIKNWKNNNEKVTAKKAKLAEGEKKVTDLTKIRPISGSGYDFLLSKIYF